MASIHSIYHYPIKGCRAVKIAASDVTTGGLVGDRQWVLVNQDGIVNQKTADVAIPRYSARAGPYDLEPEGCRERPG